MKKENDQKNPRTTSRTYQLKHGVTINYHRTHSEGEICPEFAEQVADIERRLLDESVDESLMH